MKLVALGAVLAATAALVAIPSTASAATWDVYAKPGTGGGDGGESRANLDWRTAKSLVYNKFLVNDK